MPVLCPKVSKDAHVFTPQGARQQPEPHLLVSKPSSPSLDTADTCASLAAGTPIGGPYGMGWTRRQLEAHLFVSKPPASSPYMAAICASVAAGAPMV